MELRTKEKLAKTQDALERERKAREELENLPGVKELRREHDQLQKRERAEAKKPAVNRVFQAQLHPKKQRKPSVLEQWVEVRIEEGQAVTRLYPSNEELMKRGQAMLPPPELVYRRLSFPDGVPAEYGWTTDEDGTRERGGIGIQRMEIDTCWRWWSGRKKWGTWGRRAWESSAADDAPWMRLRAARETGGCWRRGARCGEAADPSSILKGRAVSFAAQYHLA